MVSPGAFSELRQRRNILPGGKRAGDRGSYQQISPYSPLMGDTHALNLQHVRHFAELVEGLVKVGVIAHIQP